MVELRLQIYKFIIIIGLVNYLCFIGPCIVKFNYHFMKYHFSIGIVPVQDQSLYGQNPGWHSDRQPIHNLPHPVNAQTIEYIQPHSGMIYQYCIVCN